MKKRSLLTLFLTTLILSAGTQPNVIVIICDDLGYGDVGYQGGDVPTPNIDAIADVVLQLVVARLAAVGMIAHD